MAVRRFIFDYEFLNFLLYERPEKNGENVKPQNALCPYKTEWTTCNYSVDYFLNICIALSRYWATEDSLLEHEVEFGRCSPTLKPNRTAGLELGDASDCLSGKFGVKTDSDWYNRTEVLLNE